MGIILSQLQIGLVLGVLYALIASGFSLVFGVLNVVNFSQGDLCVLGAFVLLSLILVLNALGFVWGGWLFFIVVVLLAITISGIIGILIEKLTVRPFRKIGHMPIFLGSVALGFILRELLKHLYPAGANPQPFPVTLTNIQFQLGGASIRLSNMIIIGVSILVFVGLFLFVNKTRMGLTIKAASEDIEAAQMMGISINKVYTVVYFIASVIAAIAGIVNGIYFSIMQYDMGILMGIVGFSGAVFGGLGNVNGAIIGGVIIGFVESFTIAFIPGGAPYKEIFAFIIIIVFLIFRPSGILGKKAYKKV
jgi:branched-subunit amino acid ABC-type transport system permease component